MCANRLAAAAPAAAAAAAFSHQGAVSFDEDCGDDGNINKQTVNGKKRGTKVHCRPGWFTVAPTCRCV